jgi:hypothetical protein
MHRLCAFLALLTLACHGAPAAAPTPSEHALSGLAAQHVALLPTYSVRVMPGSAWGTAIGRPADLQRVLDADIDAAFDERGLRKSWVFPAALEQSYRRNSTYAADPYALAEEPLRAPTLAVDDRLPEPIASQIRTLVALHDDVRFVLAPVELRLEPVGTAPTSQAGRGVLRLVLLDARLSNVRWLGDVVSDTASSFGPVITASIAARLASVVAMP